MNSTTNYTTNYTTDYTTVYTTDYTTDYTNNYTTTESYLEGEQHRTTVYPTAGSANDCPKILTTNYTLIRNWENIPETLILNSSIALILLLIFMILTKIAWSRADSSDQLKTQNIITFLYGYRDPEQWYVIPRFEFLRYHDRHHKHDLKYPYIYVPPKLPLANPLEQIGLGNETKSVDSDRSLFPTKKRNHHHGTGTPDSKNSGAGAGSLVGSKLSSQSPPPPGAKGRSKSAKSLFKSFNILSKKSADSVLSASDSKARSKSAPLTTTHSSLNQTVTSSDRPDSEGPRSAAPGNAKFYPSILTAEQLQASYLSRKLNRFFGVFLRVSDTDLIYARGIDAYEYLLFQRHLILIMFVTTILCVGVILPIHWIGQGTRANQTLIGFQQTTIKNIGRESGPISFHWAHVICSALIVFTTLKVMSSYRDSIITHDDPQISRRTLLIGNIPKEQRTRARLTQVFREYFPHVTMEAIQFVYDSRPLIDDEMYLSSIIAAKEYCQAYKRKTNSEIFVHVTDVNSRRACDGYCRCCSFFYVCCCYWPLESREPGTTFYAKEEVRFRRRIAEKCTKLVREPAEYAFVTLKSNQQAKLVMSELASLKQDAIEGRTRQRSVSRTARTFSVDLTSRREARSMRKRKGSTDSQDSPSMSKDSPTASKDSSLNNVVSKFIETTNSNPSVKDPLDPLNNPHVRSIRGPLGTEVDGSSSSESGGEGSSSPNVSSSSLQTATKNRGPIVKKPANATTSTALAVVGAATPAADKKKSREPDKDAVTSITIRNLEGPIAWSIRYAPHPDNVEFADLLNLARTKRCTILLLHFSMIIIFIFMTTPSVVLSMIDQLSRIQTNAGTNNNHTIESHNTTQGGGGGGGSGTVIIQPFTAAWKLFINYSSVILQIITTAMLPALIILISKQIPYEDSSSKSHSIMWKVYSFLILMVIVMPSIGMSSAPALFTTNTKNYTKCLFPTDNGAYYINYTVSSIFLSTILELIKPMDIVFFYFIYWTSRSSAEIESGRQFVEREFSVGMQHTGVLLIFSVVMTYCISCPLIAPAGLVYLCVKHSVDHYNLYYSYFTKKVDKDLQTTIVMFVKVALLLMLFQTTVSIWLNTDISYFTLLSLMIFWITLATLGFNCFFDCTARTVATAGRNRHKHEFCACFYLPKVIASLLRLDAIPSTCVSRKV